LEAVDVLVGAGQQRQLPLAVYHELTCYRAAVDMRSNVHIMPGGIEPGSTLLSMRCIVDRRSNPFMPCPDCHLMHANMDRQRDVVLIEDHAVRYQHLINVQAN